MRFQVTVLGNGSALPIAGHHHSAQVVNVHEQRYLVDCGEGTQSQLSKYGIHPLSLKAIFISHLHGDHMHGVFPLLSSMGLMGRGTPLSIYAPSPFGQMLADFGKYMYQPLPFEVIWHEVDTRANSIVYENKVMQVRTIPLRHLVPSCGYLFREKTPPLNVRKSVITAYGLGIAQIVSAKRGEDIRCADGTLIPNGDITYIPYYPRSYAYCSDTIYSGKVAALVRGVDLLYHEATFETQDKVLARKSGHTTAEQAATVAARAEVGRLLIGHFSARYKDTSVLLDEAKAVFPRTFEATEGTTFNIPLKRNE